MRMVRSRMTSVAEDTLMSLFPRPRAFGSFKDSKLYSVEWAQQTLIGTTLEYHVISKRDEGVYWDFGSFETLSEAFSVRRSLASKDSAHSYFLRAAKKRYMAAEADHTDLWREAFKTGADHLIPSEQLKDYRVWVAKKVSSRQAQARFSDLHRF